jgi:RNA polymerase sigma-70 factor (ECF subfamily)
MSTSPTFAIIPVKPLSRAKSRLARARIRMQDCLQGFWELLPEKFRLIVEGRA